MKPLRGRATAPNVCLAAQTPVSVAPGRWQRLCGCSVAMKLVLGPHWKGAALLTWATFSENKPHILFWSFLIRAYTWGGKGQSPPCTLTWHFLNLPFWLTFAGLSADTFLRRELLTELIRRWLSLVTKVVTGYPPNSSFVPYYFVQNGNIIREGRPSPREWNLIDLILNAGFFESDWLRGRHMTFSSQRCKGKLMRAGGTFWSTLLPFAIFVYCHNDR